MVYINGTALSIMGVEADLNGSVNISWEFTAALDEIGINFIGQLSNGFVSGICNAITNTEAGNWDYAKE